MGPYLTLDLENSWTFAKNMLNHESELYARALALLKIIILSCLTLDLIFEFWRLPFWVIRDPDCLLPEGI